MGPAEILKVVAQAAGIGGIALGVLLILFREVIRKSIFPQLTKHQAFRLFVLLLVLVWSIALAGIGAWVWITLATSPTSSTEETSVPTIPALENPKYVTPSAPEDKPETLPIESETPCNLGLIKSNSPITDDKVDVDVMSGKTEDPSRLSLDVTIDNQSGEAKKIYSIEKTWCYSPHRSESNSAGISGVSAVPIFEKEYTVTIPIDPNDSSLKHVTEIINPLIQISSDLDDPTTIRFNINLDLSTKTYLSDNEDVFFGLHMIDQYTGKGITIISNQSWQDVQLIHSQTDQEPPTNWSNEIK